MAEVIDPVWIAWSGPEHDGAGIAARLARVREHYAEIAPGPLLARGWSDGWTGVATIALDPPIRRFPSFVEDQRIAGGFAYVPLPWERLSKVSDPGAAGLPTANAIEANPERVAEEISAPFVAAVCAKDGGELVVVNDALGAGRLYEGELRRRRVWSNRLGAIPLFLGTRPLASVSGWRLFAAAAWFIREPTAIAGIERVAPGSVLRILRGEVERDSTGALNGLVGVAETSSAERLDAIIEEFTGTARATARLYDAPAKVDLSGGRDSRLAAAAMIAAEAPARFRTSDLVPGEADVARDLIERLQRLGIEADHDVRWGDDAGTKTYERTARERARSVHHLHDGMRHAAKLRGKNEQPPPLPRAATISGHGGEIAHGFYYTTERALAKLERGGEDAVITRLEEAARRSHGAARAQSYTEARSAFEASLAVGQAAGVAGPALLDFFYLAERFAHRSGLAADTQRITLFAGGAFIAAAFGLSPRERLAQSLHDEAIARLVPAWADVPFFVASPPARRRMRDRFSLRALRGPGPPADKRTLIWEGADGDEVEELLAAEGAWTEIYDPDRVRELWSLARSGQGNAHYQDVFEGIVYREAFSDHLDLLASRAAETPPSERVETVRLTIEKASAGR